MATSSGSANAHRRFEAIYDEHVTAIHRFVYARVGNRPDAEDLTGQVFMRAVEQLDIDGSDLAAYDQTDAIFLEEIAALLAPLRPRDA